MALSQHRRTAPPGRPPGAGSLVAGFTAGDVARSLRRARLRQGLSLTDVSARTGVPVAQLRAAETGAFDLPDQMASLKTVRRYADFLGLPGDRYALALVEHWPTRAIIPAPGAGGNAPTASVPVGGVADRAHDRTTSQTWPGAPSLLGAPIVLTSPIGTGWTPDPLDTANHDTGVTPAVRSTAPPVRRRPRRRRWLKVAVAATTVTVIAAAAVLTVARISPRVLQDLGVARNAAVSTGDPAAAASQAHPGGAGASASGPAAATHRSTPAVAASTVQPTTTSGSSATFTLPSAPFQLTVSASNGACWVEVTTPTTGSQLFGAVLEPGQSETLTVARSAQVQLGSAAGRISASAHAQTLVATYAPATAPFTATLTG